MKESGWILIGEVLKPRGNKGELKVKPLTDFPGRFTDLESVHLGRTEESCQPYAVENVRWHGEHVLLKLEGIEGIDDASKMRELLLFIPPESLVELPEDEYYIFEIEGLTVYDNTGKKWGTVSEVLSGRSHDIYVIRKNGGEDILIPAVKEIVEKIDLKTGRMHIRPIPGLKGADDAD